MINLKKLTSLSLCVALGAAFLILATGCGSAEEETVAVAPPPPPPPAPPPPPPITPIAQLMEDLNIDRRVVLPEEKAPDNDEDRRAVLVFFDALARGNDQSLKGMLAFSDQLELQALVDSGAWKSTVSRIKKIDVLTGNNELNKCALAVVELAGSDFQPQLWYYTIEDENPKYEAAPAPPGILDKLTGDWIVTWHKILADELALADVPEEPILVVKRNLDNGSDRTGMSGPTVAPGGGGGGGLRPPPTTPIAPPRPPRPGS